MQSNEAPRCQHIKTNGTQCGSPALKDNQFCYYHQQCRTVTFNYRGMYRDYSASEVHLPAFEDVHSIQFTLRQVTELILRHKIDLKEAGLILYALQIASSNLKRLELDEPEPEDVVTDAQIEHPVETPEQAEAFKELQADGIDMIYGCESEADQSEGQEQAEAPANIPTLNFAKNAKFRMGHPAASGRTQEFSSLPVCFERLASSGPTGIAPNPPTGGREKAARCIGA
jgi:hypothetical protein